MRTRLNKQDLNALSKISTPTVQDVSQFSGDLLSVSFDGNAGVQAKLQILEPLASGGQGEVLDAKLLFLESDSAGIEHKREYPCVVKHLFTLSDPSTPIEFKMQQALTNGHPSDESGLLRIMGIHTVTDEEGQTHKYAIMPKCEVILANCLPAIRALDKNEYKRPLFYHVIMHFLRSILRGLQNLAEHQVAHRDHKLENIGLHNGTWCMLDFGLARSYADLVPKKNLQIEGTPHYISPEMINDESNYPFESDVWALGQILRKLRGESCSYQHNEYGEELPLRAHLYEKLSAYMKQRNQKKGGASAFDAANYQLELQGAILQKSDFKDGLDVMVDAMCHILPEYRPNLETLQKACIHLESLLPKLSFGEQLDEFYHHMTQEDTAEEVEIASPKGLKNTASFHHSPCFFAEKKSHADNSVDAEMQVRLHSH